MTAPRTLFRYLSLRHMGGFFLTGGTAYVIDTAVLLLLVHGAGIDPFTARVAAIGAAMIVAWQMHRRITFSVTAKPTIAEGLRYAAVAWSAALVNFGTYAALLLLFPTMAVIVAQFASSAVAALFSYLGLRFGVFARRPRQPKLADPR
jgi:putative flippase GtrA